MKYNFIHDLEASKGTSLQGYVYTTYDKLVRAFGQPDIGPNASERDGSTCKWSLAFDDSVVVTIYDDNVNYTPKDSYDWRIGGFDVAALTRVQKIVLGLK